MLSRSIQLSLILAAGCCSVLAADEPALHQQIDELIHARQLGPVAQTADDAAFLRRVSLDLVGCIPPLDDVEAFLQDDDPNKRPRLIDRLLASSDYPRNMAVVFDLMLMERRGGKHVKSEEFRSYLEQALAENRSYLDIVREILAADGTDEKNRQAAAFYLEREVEPHLLTRDVGRVFFGIDLQCAQCHDHPNIDDYHQPDYYGLQAFFVRSSLFQADKKQPAAIAEQAVGEASFKSVFTEREGTIGPRIPEGGELVTVTLKPTDQFQVAPAKNVRPIPSQSRREQLAAVVAESPSPAFDRNIVNRLWAHMFGRGLVHPVDLHHSDNPPTHPEVLDLLARRFVASNYDVRWLLRELALTKTYQRSFQLPDLQPSIDDANERIAAAQASAEQADERAAQSEAQWEALLEAQDAAVAEAKPYREAEAAANTKVAEALKARDEAHAKVTKLQSDVATRETQVALLQKSVETTKAAAQALKDNKELAAALDTIDKQAAASATELEQQQAALTTEQSTLATTEEALTTASAAADEAIAVRVPYEEKVRQLRGKLYTARQQTQHLRTAANVARQDVAYLESLVDYGQAQQQVATLTEAWPQHEADIAANATAVADADAALAASQSNLEEAQAAVTAGQIVASMATTALQSVEQSHSKLTEAIANAESAQANLPEDDAIKNAVALLKSSLAAVDAQLSQAESNVATAETELNGLTQALAAVNTTHNQAQNSLEDLKQRGVALRQQLSDDTQTLAATRATLNTTWEALVDESAARGNATMLTPLTPEQLAWSTLIATGQLDRLQAAAKAKIEQAESTPEGSTEGTETAGKPGADHAKELDELVKGPITTFVKLYGPGAGQPQHDFFATAEQSLFAANGGEIYGWLQPGGGNLTERLIALEDAPAIARELYRALLSRNPTEEEFADVAGYIAEHADQKPQAVQQLAWGLLTSVEFRFRH